MGSNIAKPTREFAELHLGELAENSEFSQVA